MSDQQKPSVGRVVHFTGNDGSGPYAAVVTAFPAANLDAEAAAMEGRCDLTSFGSLSIHFHIGVRFDANGAPNTWRWPPRT